MSFLSKGIVLYHGGKEFCRYPSPRLYRLCHAMAKHGADVVLCQHSHCIGTCENFEGCHILYGQGNFHFVRPHDFDGWHAFCESMKDTYIKSVADAYKENSDEGQNQRLAHYLDCEAHTDVYRELFQTYNQTNEK